MGIAPRGNLFEASNGYLYGTTTDDHIKTDMAAYTEYFQMEQISRNCINLATQTGPGLGADSYKPLMAIFTG